MAKSKDWCNKKDPTNKKVLDFVEKYRNYAQAISNTLDVPLEFILGLAGAESNYGTSNIAQSAKNFFGQGPGASGGIGIYITTKKARVAKFLDFQASAESFAKDFGSLVRGIKDKDLFVQALIPKFNTADKGTNGNPFFKKITIQSIDAISNRINCDTQQSVQKCGAICKDFKKYGHCDRPSRSGFCWQHSLTKKRKI